MKIRLNTWQTFALFLPSILGAIIVSLPHSNFRLYEMGFATANLLLLFNIAIVVFYQTYLVLGFNRDTTVKSNLFKLNALIPTIFFVAYFVFVLYLNFNKPSYHVPQSSIGPMTKVNFNWASWIVVVLTIHGFITFYFINSWFVAKKIRENSDVAEQQELITDFLTPIKRLIKISLWIIVALVSLTIVIDIISVGKF